MKINRSLALGLVAALGIGLASADGVFAGGWGPGYGGHGMRTGGPGCQTQAIYRGGYRHYPRHVRARLAGRTDVAGPVSQARGPGKGWRAQAGLCPLSQFRSSTAGDVTTGAPPGAGRPRWGPRNGTGPRARMGLCPYAASQSAQQEG